MRSSHFTQGIFSLFLLSFLSLSEVAASTDNAGGLVLALSRTPLETQQGNIKPRVFRFDPGGDANALGLIGAVRITFPGGDRKAQISYYVFSNTGNAITYDNRHLALPVHAGKLLSYPPLAQCDNRPLGGYCEMVVQDLSVVIVTTTSASMDTGSGPLMALAFRHLFNVASVADHPTSAPDAGRRSTCSLVDPVDVEAALGSVVRAPFLDGIGGCSWRAARGELSIQRKDGGRKQFEFDRSRMNGTSPLAGLGDDAFAFRSLAGFVQLNVLKGRHYVIIIVQPANGGDPMPAAEQLARKIVGRM